MTAFVAAPPKTARPLLAYVEELKALSRKALVHMFRPEDEFFIWCQRRHADGIRPEGCSRRYTAITALGLMNERDEVVREILHGRALEQLTSRLLRDIAAVDNLGDVALTLWLANAQAHPDAGKADARLRQLDPLHGSHYTVELAWAVSALAHDRRRNADRAFGRQVAQRLMATYSQRGALFPHLVDGGGGFRAHVGCFADQVYPIQALSFFSTREDDAQARRIADETAAKICELLGRDGQWWWHYDARTGDVVEGYPVYAVHQNSMAPMALFAIQEAGGGDYWSSIALGLRWLRSAPEIGGQSLVDAKNQLIWRKVGRREPSKLTRKLQAGASRLHPALRFPGVNTLFPPTAIDYECRPYHLGWVLYAWPESRLKKLADHPSGDFA